MQSVCHYLSILDDGTGLVCSKNVGFPSNPTFRRVNCSLKSPACSNDKKIELNAGSNYPQVFRFPCQIQIDKYLHHLHLSLIFSVVHEDISESVKKTDKEPLEAKVIAVKRIYFPQSHKSREIPPEIQKSLRNFEGFEKPGKFPYAIFGLQPSSQIIYLVKFAIRKVTPFFSYDHLQAF